MTGTAAASCPIAAAAALLGLYIVCEGMEIVSAAVLIAPVDDFDQRDGAAAAKHEFVSDLLLLNGSAAVCLLAAAAAAFLVFPRSSALGFLVSGVFGETDRLRAMSSISGPGINAFSWGRGCNGMLKNKEREVFASAHHQSQRCQECRRCGERACDQSSSRIGRCRPVRYLGSAEFPASFKSPFFLSRGRSAGPRRWGLDEILSHVIGSDGLDVYAMVQGKIVDLSSTLSSAGIVGDCTVHIQHPLRGGSREDVPGQWTCSQFFAPRCWPVRKRCYRCGAAREDLPVSS